MIGCGDISGIYLKTLTQSADVEVRAVADLDAERASRRSSEFGVPAVDPREALGDPRVEVVVNLTVPSAHHQVALDALRAGKHVYNEKPLAVRPDQGWELLEVAKEHGLRVGAAPDTVLGAGVQTCRDLVDSGAIGTPVAAQAFMMCPGHEGWHPNPDFYYQPGGGPLFDMGPYYLSALVTLLGPVDRVVASARSAFSERTIGHGGRKGQPIPVETPTHIVAALDFASGPTVQLTTSFDVLHHTLPPIELYGSEGTLQVPDPNGFGGPIRLRRRGEDAWAEVPLARPYAENTRGLGVVDMVRAIREGRPHRASGALAQHVLETMQAALDSDRDGRRVTLPDGPQRPEPMPREAW